MSYEKTAPKRYFWELIIALALMFATVRLIGFVTHHTHDPHLVIAARLLILLPILLAVTAVVRLYRRQDEFQRLTLLKTAAFAAALSLLVFMLLPVLHMLGLPPIPPHFPLAPLVMSTSCIICGLTISFLHKRADMGTAGALLHVAPVSMILLVPGGYWLANLFLPLPHMTFRLGMILATACALAAGGYEIFVRSRAP
jgi:hypothetical protein